MKLIFQCLGVIGVGVIIVLAFTLPSNPYEIIPALTMMSFDKPLWLCIIISSSFFYLVALFSIYNGIEKRKIA